MTVKNEKIKLEFDLQNKAQSYGFGHRHIQALLVCIFVAISFIMRVNMSVAIVAMTDKTQNTTNIEIYDWNKKTQDIILSSFFWGYTSMQIPIGYIAERFGAKPLFTIATMVNGFITLLTPLAVRWGGWIAMCVCRSIQGVAQSCVFPGTMVIASRWIPNHERSRLTNFMFSGITLGTVIGMSLSSMLASSTHGWPSVFYVIGAATIVFGILWIFFASSNPASHKYISEEEREFIHNNISFSRTEKKRKTPIKHILKSPPFYAILFTQVGCVWMGNTIIMEMPSYINKVLGINMRDSGLYSALPFIGMWVWSMLVSVISDWIINNKILRIITSRRIFNTFGTWLPGILLTVMTFIPQDHPYLVIAFFVPTASFLTSINVGFMLSFIDIAPNFSGTILGMTNFISQLVGIFAPIVVGVVVKEETNPHQWQIVFMITSAIIIITNLIYIIFMSADIQPWNNLGEEDISKEKAMNKAPTNEDEEQNMLMKQSAIILE